MKEKSLDRGIYILKSLAISFVLTLILVLIVSTLLTYTSLKESKIPLLNTMIMIFSITIGSIYMAIKVEENGWLNGGIIGGLYFIILILLNYLFIKPFMLDIYSISKFFIALTTGIIGGIIGVNIK
ncbi:TIGR04086 family membrane protein [Clostridium sp. Cult2]|uniref:TIGR04086 family membrane protein n=1 Tax=Clostridium sp. Cult2 TaxID=2079003 RepID=UPI001F19BD95|nr:TIGR04086 family membrane protein [Clostridium sp. Cult2]MCF6465915.1 TIGR04086 family membrane protein [Clostridium sp. Cult2]